MRAVQKNAAAVTTEAQLNAAIAGSDGEVIGSDAVDLGGTMSLSTVLNVVDGADTIGLASMPYAAGAPASLTVGLAGNHFALALSDAPIAKVPAVADSAGGAPLDTSGTISTEAQLNATILAADNAAAGSGVVSADLGANISLTTALKAINLRAGVTLDIEGEGYAIDGGGTQRGLFVYAGNVTLENLTIRNAVAQGGSGGGGGAGLGGGLYVADDTSDTTIAGSVTLTNVAFSNDAAIGGRANRLAGGGGLGGSGGGGPSAGGGGVGGNGATAKLAAGAGIIPRLSTAGSGGGGGSVPGVGGSGGGVAGQPAASLTGGVGGYGGGGGVGPSGGAGGFGGGGGTGLTGSGGAGGFGGGAGSSQAGKSVGGASGGFGGGHAGSDGASGIGGGGGGLGAGGDIFVQEGASITIAGGSTITAGTVKGGIGSIGVNGGTPGAPGAAYGSGIFLQGNEVLDLAPEAGQATAISGVIADETGSADASGQSGTGSLVLTGLGSVTLSAINTFTGGVTIDGGVLDLAGAASGGSGAITFAPGAAAVAHLVIEAAATPIGTPFANTLVNFGTDCSLDLKGLAFSAGETAAVAGGVLTVTSGAKAAQFNVKKTSFTTFDVFNDGSGGTLVTLGGPVLANPGPINLYTTASGPAIVAGQLTVADPENPDLLSATVSITGSFLAGDELGFTAQNGISGSYNPATGVLTLSGSASVADYQAALEQVTYSSTLADPTDGGLDPTRRVSFTVSDGLASSTPLTATLSLVPINNEAQLNGAIAHANAAAAGSGTVIIALNANISLSTALTAISVKSGVTVDIEGGGHTIDGLGTYGGLVVQAGAATIEDLTVTGTVAKGGVGDGGGAGLGGGLFVGDQASKGLVAGSVTLTNVTFSNEEAAGGAAVGTGAAGGSDGIGGAFGVGAAAGSGLAGGFGGGHAGANGASGIGGAGGGLGAGGDVFVQQGASLTINGGVALGASTTVGGAGQPGSGTGLAGANGSAYGGSLFLQGAETVTFDPLAGQTVTVAGTIADETGSADASGAKGAGGLLLDGGGVLALTVANSFTGGVTVKSGELDLAVTGAAGSGAISFANAGSATASLVFETGATPTGTQPFTQSLIGFGAGDSIDLKGLDYSPAATVSYASGILSLVDNGATLNFNLSAPHTTTFYLHPDGQHGVLINTVAPQTDVWNTVRSGDWSNVMRWSLGAAPDDGATDAVFSTKAVYTVTLVAGESFTAENVTVLNAATTLALAGALEVTGQTSLNVGAIDIIGAGTLDGVVSTGPKAQIVGAGFIDGAVTNLGLIKAQGGALDITGPVTGAGGRLSINRDAILEVGAIAAGQAITFLAGAAETLILDDLAATQAQISGFLVGDTIDLKAVIATSATFAGGILKLFDGSAQVGAIRIKGSTGGNVFELSSDLGGGTDIVLGPAAASTSRDVARFSQSAAAFGAASAATALSAHYYNSHSGLSALSAPRPSQLA
jgi:hypothetical protein